MLFGINLPYSPTEMDFENIIAVLVCVNILCNAVKLHACGFLSRYLYCETLLNRLVEINIIELQAR
jgi:NADH:ubiquinone oxidoreductase subunit K